MKFRKTALIEAEQFNEAEWQKKYKACQHPDEWDRVADKLGIDHYLNHFVIRTLEGEILVHDGDWIATGVNGEHWAIADDVFKKTYAKLPVIPEAVADYIESFSGGETDLDIISVATAVLGAIEYDQSSREVSEWITNFGDEFARAYLDGYVVESNYSATPRIPK